MDILVLQNVSDTLAVVNDILDKVVEINSNTQPDLFVGMRWADMNKVEYLGLLFAFLAFIASVISVVVDFKGFMASKRTADNVMRISEEVQLAQFADLIRHFYRNLIVSIGIARKVLTLGARTDYPSELHFLKLKVLADDYLHLEKYNSDSQAYSRMHELKLLCRNYDVEIDTAISHVKDKRLLSKDLEGDMDNLLFKPLFLVTKICGVENDVFRANLSKNNKTPFDQAAIIIISEHLNKLTDNISALLTSGITIIPSGYPWSKLYKALDDFIKGKTKTIGEWRLNWSEILSPENPYLKSSAREFFNELYDKVKGTPLATFNGGQYCDFIQSASFPVKEMILLAIYIDAAIEEKKIKTLTL